MRVEEADAEPESDSSGLVFEDPPSGLGRGRVSPWPARFDQMLDESHGKWVNATKTWGAKASCVSTPKRIAARLELQCETKTQGETLWLRIW